MSPLGIDRLRIDPDRCIGCGACMAACAAGAISLQDGMACITEALCRSCEACVRACPQGAIIAVRSGDVLPAPATAAVSRPQAQVASARPGGALARLAARALPAIGTALAAVGRDVILRAVDGLVDRWAGEPTAPDAQPPQSAPTRYADGHGARHRYRGGRA